MLTSTDKDMEHENSHTFAGRSVNWYKHFGNLVLFPKVEDMGIFDLEVPLLGIYPTEMNVPDV